MTCTFIADKAAANIYIYVGAMPGAHYKDNVGLGFWIDDVMFISLDYALSNVIRTSVTEIDIVDAASPLTKFTLGTDFIVINATGGFAPTQVDGRGNFRGSPDGGKFANPDNVLDSSLLSTLLSTE